MLPVHRARSSDAGELHSAAGSETSESGVPAHSHGSNHIHESHLSESHRYGPATRVRSGRVPVVCCAIMHVVSIFLSTVLMSYKGSGL